MASPRPAPITLAAAAAAGADGLLAVGGAHAIAALAYGVGGPPPCDVVVGPGNRWVTAAKKAGGRGCRHRHAGGPLRAGGSGGRTPPTPRWSPPISWPRPSTIRMHCRCWSRPIQASPVRSSRPRAPARGPADTGDRRRRLSRSGFAVVADMDEAVEICDRLAPEHLQILTGRRGDGSTPQPLRRALRRQRQRRGFRRLRRRTQSHAAHRRRRAFQGGTVRVRFPRVRTWLQMDGGPDTGTAMADAAALARLEGLEAHARAAERRLTVLPSDR